MGFVSCKSWGQGEWVVNFKIQNTKIILTSYCATLNGVVLLPLWNFATFAKDDAVSSTWPETWPKVSPQI